MSSEVVHAVASQVRERYVVADVGDRAAAALEQAFAGGALAHDDGPTFAADVTAVLREATGDAHLQLRHSEAARDPSRGSDWDDPEYLAAYWRKQDRFNQGIPRAERMRGNVGLLVVESIDEPEGTGPVVEAGLAFLARCDALVLDVRESNGGATTGVAFLVSHFVDAPAQHVLDVVRRDGSVQMQSWTQAYVRGPRLVDQPLFVLTSARTPSGTEELAYDLQAMGRATVVGETTVGAANPVELVVVDPHFVLRLPTLRVVHHLTGTNWEGTGVVPDVACAAEDALDVAHRLAARAVLAGVPDLPDGVRAELEDVAGSDPADGETGRLRDVFEVE